MKRFHPDANGGDRGAEERLKQVIKAYGVLRASGPDLRAALRRALSASSWLGSQTQMNDDTQTAGPRSRGHARHDGGCARTVFGIDTKMKVPAFSRGNEHVPDRDSAYRFDRETTLAILAGFAFNRRVMIQGYHGTGKSTHIEQVAARLNWPCIRINLDSHISRIDLIGKDAIVLQDGQQVTEFREGLLPWALQRPWRWCSTNMTPAGPM